MRLSFLVTPVTCEPSKSRPHVNQQLVRGEPRAIMSDPVLFLQR